MNEPGLDNGRKLVLLALLPLLPLALWFGSLARSAGEDARFARQQQCGIAYNLLLRQLIERIELPNGRADGVLLTQLQIAESEDCGGKLLRERLPAEGGAERLQRLAEDTSTPAGRAAYRALLFSLLAETGRALQLKADPAPEAQAYAELALDQFARGAPLLGALARGSNASLRPALLRHLDEIRPPPADVADGDVLDTPATQTLAQATGPAVADYQAALRKAVQTFGQEPQGRAAATKAGEQLYRLHDLASVWRHKALQANIERQLDLRRVALIAVAFIVIVALGVIVWLVGRSARDVSRRIQQLVAASRRTGEGDLSLSVAVRGSGEVSQLERAFNQMTADLRKSYQKIIDELKVALDTAQTAEKAKSDFLHNVSHELRTPMNAILGMSHLALQSGLDPRQRGHVEQIQKSANGLVGIINGILDFSKMGSGEMKAEQAEFDLGLLLRGVALEAQTQARAKSLDFGFAVAAEVPLALVGDAALLAKVLSQYLDNALKFTERGRVDLAVSRVGGDARKATLRFTVSDTGIGMTAEQQGHLFKSIRQGDGSATRKYGGTGLGLVVAKQLAVLMGGTVGAQSTLGAGSEFWLELAFDRAAALQPAPFSTELVAALPTTDVQPPAVLGAQPFDPAVLDRLVAQVEAYDSEAADTLTALRGMAGADLALLSQLEQCLAGFDFDEAQRLLPALRASLGAS